MFARNARVDVIVDAHSLEKAVRTVAESSLAKCAVVAGVLAAAGCAARPPAGPLVSDRPDFTESAVSVEPGHVQVEGGYTWADEDGGSTHSLGEVLARFGLAGRLEARIGLNSLVGVEVAGEREWALEDASLGAKLVMLGDGSPVAAALLVGSTIPTGESPVGGDVAVPGLTLALARHLNDRASLGANVLAEWPEDGAGGRYTDLGASLSLGLGVGERTGLFLEIFGFTAPERGGGDRLYFDGGLTQQATDALQIDARVGGGEGGWFFGVGVVRRW